MLQLKPQEGSTTHRSALDQATQARAKLGATPAQMDAWAPGVQHIRQEASQAPRGLPGAWPFPQCTEYGRRGSVALSSRGSTEGSLTPDTRKLHSDGPGECSHTKISRDSREAVKACAVFSKPSDHEIINSNDLNSTKWHTLMFSVVTRGILVPSGLSGDLRGTQQAAFFYVKLSSCTVLLLSSSSCSLLLVLDAGQAISYML